MRVYFCGKDLQNHDIINIKVNKTVKVVLKHIEGIELGKLKVECIFNNNKYQEVSIIKPQIEKINEFSSTHHCGFSIIFKTTTYDNIKAKLKISYLLTSEEVKKFETEHYFTITVFETSFESKNGLESSYTKIRSEESKDVLITKDLSESSDLIDQSPLSYPMTLHENIFHKFLNKK